MRDDFTMATEQISLTQTTVQLFQTSIRNGGKDMVFKVVLHSGSHEVILEPSGAAGSRDPVHTVRVA